jgi:phosphatidylserine/phosphatidylglycerophosphate/cardiolipin synthase-like enzyme
MIKRILFTALFIIIITSPAIAEPIISTCAIDVYFSPNGGPTEAIVKEINNAKREILVQAYTFTSQPIAKAIIDAHMRGIKIEVILDKIQRGEKYTAADFVAHDGIPTYIDDKHAIAHNKIMIIDRSTLITGSFNFTRAAEEKNAENLLVIKGNNLLVERYIRNFDEHKAHSEPYRGE